MKKTKSLDSLVESHDDTSTSSKSTSNCVKTFKRIRVRVMKKLKKKVKKVKTEVNRMSDPEVRERLDLDNNVFLSDDDKSPSPNPFIGSE